MAIEHFTNGGAKKKLATSLDIINLQIQIIITYNEEVRYDFVGASAKSREGAISFVMPVCPSVHNELGFQWKDFYVI